MCRPEHGRDGHGGELGELISNRSVLFLMYKVEACGVRITHVGDIRVSLNTNSVYKSSASYRMSIVKSNELPITRGVRAEAGPLHG